MSTQNTDLSIDQMRAALGAQEAPIVKVAEPAAEAQKPANPEGDPTTQSDKPAADATQGDNNAPASGADETSTDKQEPTDKGEDTQDGKFEAKDSALPKGVQKKIDKATYLQREAERQAAAAKREAEELRAKLEEKSQAPGKPATDEPPKAATDKPAEFQFAEVEPKEDDFDTIGEYIKATAAWQTRHDIAQDRFNQQQAARVQAETQQRTEAQRYAAEAQTKWETQVAAAIEADPKVGLMLQDEKFGKLEQFLSASGQLVPIQHSAVAVEIVRHLHEHPEAIMDAASTGDPKIVGFAIKQIEKQILASKSKAPQPKPDMKSPGSDLPEPVAVVGGKASAVTGVDLNDDKVDTATWMKEARRQLQVAR